MIFRITYCIKYLSLILLITCGKVFSQQVVLFGEAKEYSNESIEVYGYTDYVTKNKKNLIQFKVSNEGTFSCSFHIEETQAVFFNLGVYLCKIFVKPGEKYEIVLPPKTDKNIEEELNPYFEPQVLLVGIKNKGLDNLNYKITVFDEKFNSFVSENFNWLYLTGNMKPIDSLEKSFDKEFADFNDTYFKSYKDYRFAMLRHFTFERDRNFVVRKYLLNRPILYQNEAYMHFFNETFNEYFSSPKVDKTSELINEAIVYYKSPKQLKNILEYNIAFRNDTLKEMIILKGLRDCYKHPDIFPYSVLDQTVDSLSIISKIPVHREIARNIKLRALKLKPGDNAPSFELKNIEGQSVSLQNYKGKYLYLIFCRSENFTCLKDYKLIKPIFDEQYKDLEIVTASSDKNFSVFSNFIKDNREEFPWTFLYAENENSIYSDYQIKTLPEYFLIDPEGKIAMLPAPSPHENFKWYFSMIIKWREASKNPKQNVKNDGIYRY